MGLFDGILNIVGGIFDNNAADERQETANNFSAHQFATRYQTTVKDLTAAGLNPMLAYPSGGGNAPTSAAASAAPIFSNAINQARLTTAQVANIDADTENKKASADLIQAQIAREESTATSNLSSSRQADAMTEKIIEETKNIPIEGRRIVATIQMLNEQAGLMSQQNSTQVEITKVQAQTLVNLMLQNELTAKQAAKIIEETKLLKYDVQAAAQFNNLGRDVKQIQPLLDILRPLLLRK